MSTVDERIQTIKTQLVGNSGVRVLLVEGPDDVDAYRIFLDRKFPGWERKWHIEPAGKKASVVKMAKKKALGSVWWIATSGRMLRSRSRWATVPTC